MTKQLNDLEFYDINPWWDESAKLYALNRLNPFRFAYFDRFISNWEGLKVLDVGCGGGFTCEFLAKRNAIVSGIDISQNAIATAIEHSSRNGYDIDYKCGFSENLSYNDNSFDVIVCVDVLEHVADVSKTISEIGRVLRPGGYFFYDTINRTFKSKLVMIWLLEDILGEIKRGIHDWNKFIKPEELSELMEENELGRIEIKGFNIFGKNIFENLATYQQYKKTGGFRININEDTSVIYIGKAEKPNNL